MRLLILDRNLLNALAQAIRLSGSGLIVETVASLAELEHRLESMNFDGVLLNDSTPAQGVKLTELEKRHPDTRFFSPDEIADFIEFIGENEDEECKSRLRDRIRGME